MINFPIFEKLEVDEFGLYPGNAKSHGLKANFRPGLTLVLGSNGLGKTTLVTVLFRMLTGPFDIPALTKRADLGNAKLDVTALNRPARRAFAQRVSDGASNARATLQFTIGKDEVILERRLADLTLSRFSLNGEEQPTDEMESFQPKIAKLAGVWSFGDWILLLRHMVFYFEDRRELVWDPSAQRQLLRTLLLSPSLAQQWTQDERSILELDSRMRNLRFAVGREERALSEVETKVEKGTDVKEELKALEELQGADFERREVL
ncbi:MAG: ATP-binding protein [Pseudomonadota bacterium]